ncbi:MAG TPA: complex I subunit 5 family protein [Acidobacteriaceae bacterium]|nr:complex I subunit 5 family protein [Acidobacteriaceae bacterium]
MTTAPALPVAVPMLCAAFLAAVRKWLPRFFIDLVAVLAALFNLVLCLWLLHVSWSKSIVYWFGNWFPRGHMVVGIGFVIDPMGATLAVVAAFLTLLGLIYSSNSMESGKNHYQPLMLIFLAAMTGFCFTADLFNLFVFFELMSTAAFALCGLKTEEPSPLQGAFNFAVTNTVGAFFTLTGIGILYGATGALNMAQMGMLLGQRHDSLVLVACLLIITGFLIKAAVFPFHFWLPDAHSVAPTPVCVLFSGLMVELGLFAILRVTSVIFGSSFAGAHDPLRSSFLVLGGTTAVWGGMMSFAEHHLKRVLAFSTISHSGLMLFAMGVGTPKAIAGWLIYACGHAAVKSGLFFTAGILLHRLRTMSEPALFARGKGLKFTAVLWFLGGCGLAALPPFATSIGEDMVSQAKHGSLELACTAFFLVSGILTGGAVFRVFMRVFCGWGDRGPSDRAAQVDELPEMSEEHRTIPFRIFAPAAACVLAGIGLAFLPRLDSMLLHAAKRVLDQAGYIATVYAAPQNAGMAVGHHGLKIGTMIAHGFIAVVCAWLLASWAVFHRSIPRRLRWPSHLEGSLRWARQLQSGQPADYVAWAMAGVAALGGALFLMK